MTPRNVESTSVWTLAQSLELLCAPEALVGAVKALDAGRPSPATRRRVLRSLLALHQYRTLERYAESGCNRAVLIVDDLAGDKLAAVLDLPERIR